MPDLITQKIQFNNRGGSVSLEFSFDTILICTYEVDLRERASNQSVAPFPVRGDNTNPEDDRHTMPPPTDSNDGRTIWAPVTIVDQSGQGGTYNVTITFEQDGKSIGTITTTKKQLNTPSTTEFLVVRLIGCE